MNRNKNRLNSSFGIVVVLGVLGVSVFAGSNSMMTGKMKNSEMSKSDMMPAMMSGDMMMMPGYMDASKALASDDFKAAKEALKSFQTSLSANTNASLKTQKEAVLKELATALTAKDITELRKSFKPLSEKVMDLCRAGDFQKMGMKFYQCPMSKGTWSTTNATVENPYYGKSMMDCGSMMK